MYPQSSIAEDFPLSVCNVFVAFALKLMIHKRHLYDLFECKNSGGH